MDAGLLRAIGRTLGFDNIHEIDPGTIYQLSAQGRTYALFIPQNTDDSRQTIARVEEIRPTDKIPIPASLISNEDVVSFCAKQLSRHLGLTRKE